jgi:hypothetical protein
MFKKMTILLLLPTLIRSSESLVLELVMLKHIAELQYEDINAIANVRTYWRHAVEKTGDQRKEFITQHLLDEIPYFFYSKKMLNKNDLVWNKHSTACCFVDVYCFYPALFRAQLTKGFRERDDLHYDVPITTFVYDIPDKDQRAGKRRLEQGSGFTKRYLFATCNSNNVPIDNMHTTCFAPFFNNRDEACIHVFRCVAQQTPITEYSLNYKGKSRERACFIDTEPSPGPKFFVIKDALSHFIAFQFASITRTKIAKTFVFDDAAKKRVAEFSVIVELIRKQVEQEEHMSLEYSM